MLDVRYAILCVFLVPSPPAPASDAPTPRQLTPEMQLEYARSRLEAAEKAAEFRLMTELGQGK